eukprot:9354539-Ditylum_brightwellii.AAC.1
MDDSINAMLGPNNHTNQGGKRKDEMKLHDKTNAEYMEDEVKIVKIEDIPDLTPNISARATYEGKNQPNIKYPVLRDNNRKKRRTGNNKAMNIDIETKDKLGN